MRKIFNLSFYIVFGFTIFNVFGWPFELNFSESYLNYYFITFLCLLLTVFYFVKIFDKSSVVNIVLSVLVSGIFGLICYAIGGLAYIEGKQTKKYEVDGSFEKIREVTHNGSYYRLYRTNGGATTSYGLVLRKESPAILGIKVVQRIFSKYPASDAKLVIKGNSIELQGQHSKDGQAITIQM